MTFKWHMIDGSQVVQQKCCSYLKILPNTCNMNTKTKLMNTLYEYNSFSNNNKIRDVVIQVYMLVKFMKQTRHKTLSYSFLLVSTCFKIILLPLTSFLNVANKLFLFSV